MNNVGESFSTPYSSAKAGAATAREAAKTEATAHRRSLSVAAADDDDADADNRVVGRLLAGDVENADAMDPIPPQATNKHRRRMVMFVQSFDGLSGPQYKAATCYVGKMFILSIPYVSPSCDLESCQKPGFLVFLTRHLSFAIGLQSIVGTSIAS